MHSRKCNNIHQCNMAKNSNRRINESIFKHVTFLLLFLNNISCFMRSLIPDKENVR